MFVKIIENIGDEIMADKIKVLSLFSGCGGMDLGFDGAFYVHKNSVNSTIHPDWNSNTHKGNFIKLPKTKFDVVFANDILKEAKASWVPFFEKRGIKDVFHSESIVELVKEHKAGKFTFPEADVVTGGFPCQDFSVAGKRLGFDSHKSHDGEYRKGGEPTVENRGHLYMWMKKVIEIVKPSVFFAENVKGLVSLKNVKDIIEKDFTNIGAGYYVFDVKVLHAADYGVPQSRERVIFIGVRKDKLKKEVLNSIKDGSIEELYNPYPVPTHYSPRKHKDDKTDKNKHPYVTLGDIFADLQEPDETKDVAQSTYSRAKYYGAHCQGQKEVQLDWIGPTIRAEHHGNIEFRRLSKKHGGKHADELALGRKERRLTIRECARIQTFPDDFEFLRDKSVRDSEFALTGSNAYKVIGNAVPPLLARHLAWRLQELWDVYFK